MLGSKMRGKNDQQIQFRHGTPDFDEALRTQIEPAAEIALQCAGRHAQQSADRGQRKSEQHR